MNKTHKSTIKYHLGTETGSFLYELHENHYFNEQKFNQVLQSFDNFKVEDIDDSTKFMYLLFERITYMYDILRDLYVHPNNLNISKEQYYLYLLELKNKIKDLFDNL